MCLKMGPTIAHKKRVLQMGEEIFIMAKVLLVIITQGRQNGTN
jgi:hypothetical protein